MDMAEGGKDVLSPIPSTHIVGEENRQPQVVLLEKRKEKVTASVIEDLPVCAEKILSYTEVGFT